MKAKKLIEVALPIKEISAESARDGRLTHGHIKSLHQWWARRPLPTCRAVVFANLVPDPLDDNCPDAFKYAVEMLLNTGLGKLHYKPYKDIPYTSIVDEMEDNHRNRLMMFIGKFSEKCQTNMIAGKTTPSKEQLDDYSLIKWENKNNPQILRIARELIFVAYQSDKRPDATWEQLHGEFNHLYDAIPKAEEHLYSIPDRYKESEHVKEAEAVLQTAIEAFQNEMPSVFDPFAGGGAIPLEAARLGCRSYGNDINPVAHIIERSSAEFPQKYGKPIIYNKSEFERLYESEGQRMSQETERNITFDGNCYNIPNRLAFDVEFYAKQIIAHAEEKAGSLYPNLPNNKKVIAYFWAREATCGNPSCKAKVPMLKSFYLANNSRKKLYLSPIINGNKIDFEIKKGTCNEPSWNSDCNLKCPCCGNITKAEELKKESKNKGLTSRPLAIIIDGEKGKEYEIPSSDYIKELKKEYEITFKPNDSLAVEYSQALSCCGWGHDKWFKLFTNRQLFTLNCLLEELQKIDLSNYEPQYARAIKSCLTMWFGRIVRYNTSFGNYETANEKLNRILVRQEIHMNFDYPESNPFCGIAGSALNQLECVLEYIESESKNSFVAIFNNSSSGEKTQFGEKSINAVITDPPYYDALAYADLSDFYYVWFKQILINDYPLIFATPQTPKKDECTALKHHHEGKEDKANKHFEDKLAQIFDAIEIQTKDIVSIMFAHQTTKAWTTLCSAIISSRMNITGSWPIDTESKAGLKMDKAFLASSVTVSCRPSERKGFADYDEVKHNIRQLVKHEVEKLYGLGFRGADLITACFGQAVSVFGHYKQVETAEGDPVSVGQLLEYARESANLTIVENVPGEPQTKFYCGWLSMNGMKECDFDDVNKYTRVGVNVEIRSLQSDKLLITEGSKQHLATAEEHVGSNQSWGTQPTDYMISQVHRMMLAYRDDNQLLLLKLVRDLCPQSDAPLWRVMDFLGGHLPEGKDLADVRGLLSNAEMLRQKCKETVVPKVGTLDFED